MPNVTQSQLAKQLGIDRSTVSLCFSRPDRVKATTRERVLQAALKRGYQPNAAARATKQGRFGAVGLLQTTAKQRGYMPASLVAGIQDALAERDFTLTLAKLPDADLHNAAVPPRVLAERMVDGLLINYTHHAPDSLIRMIDRSGVPALWLNTKRSENCLYPDNLDAADRLTQHLIDLGHQKIAYIPNTMDDQIDPEGHFSHIDRLAGYQRAMRRAGLPPQIAGRSDLQTSDHLQSDLHNWLRSPNRPTACVVYFASTLKHLLAAARQLDLKLGTDLSIATFAIPEQNILFDGTAMLPPYGKLGHAAVETLCQLINSPTPPERVPAVTMPYQLHVGRTTGPPPASLI